MEKEHVPTRVHWDSTKLGVKKTSKGNKPNTK